MHYGKWVRDAEAVHLGPELGILHVQDPPRLKGRDGDLLPSGWKAMEAP